jgi:hypothetical protein
MLLCLTYAIFINLDQAHTVLLFDVIESDTPNTTTYQLAVVPVLPCLKLTSLSHDSAASCGLACQVVDNHMTVSLNVLGLHYALKCGVCLCPCSRWWRRGCEIRGCKQL